MQYACELARIDHEKEVKYLKEEVDSNKAMLLDFIGKLAEEKVKNMNLVEQSKEDKRTLENLNEKLAEEKQNNLKTYLSKPLPTVSFQAS